MNICKDCIYCKVDNKTHYFCMAGWEKVKKIDVVTGIEEISVLVIHYGPGAVAPPYGVIYCNNGLPHCRDVRGVSGGEINCLKYEEII